MKRPIITLLTDFGLTDYYVSAMKGVILGICPDAQIVDITHQIEVLDLLADLNRERGTTVVMVLHDLNLAARYADHVCLMRDGALLRGGPPAEVITAANVRETFGLDSLVVPCPVSGAPMVVPTGRLHHAQVSPLG